MMKMRRDTNFLPTESFKMDFGRIHPTDYQQIMSDILDGKSMLIPGAAGLHEIVVESFHGKAKWLVVYAVYVKWNLVVLVTKFRVHSKKKKFNLKQQIELAAWKKRLDDAVKTYIKKYE